MSHFCLKPDSEIMFVNEKNLRNHLAVSVKLKPWELNPVKLMSTATQMSLPYKSSETVFFVGHSQKYSVFINRGDGINFV